MNATLVSPADISGSVALDAAALDRLRRTASKDPKAALRQAAGQFEALLVNEMLKSARDARLDGTTETAGATGLYTSMFDEQMAQVMTRGHGFGLADMLTRQLQQRYLDAPAKPAQ